MHLPTGIRIIIMLLAMLLVGVMFMALECTYCRSDGVCVAVHEDGSACVYLRTGDGADVVCGGGSSNGGGGAGPAATVVPTATNTPTPSPSDAYKLLVSPYSYNANSATCTGDTDAIDPISLLVRSVDTVSSDAIDTVTAHLSHHGLDAESGIGEQYFKLYYPDDQYPPHNGSRCAFNLIGQASGSVTASRWHTRGNAQTWIWDPLSPAARITALTPHYDQLTFFDGCDLVGHVVPEDFYNDGQYLSGFVVARDRITSDWVASGQHTVIDVYRFGNTQKLKQCNGERPFSDGIVYHISADQ
jgi:hypothetical protein